MVVVIIVIIFTIIIVIIVVIIDAMIIVFTKWLDLNFEFDYILIFWKLPTVFQILVCKLDHLILV